MAEDLSEAAAQSKRSRLGLEPAGSRRYVSGDPRRHIHWRNTARAGQPMVKEFDDPSQGALYLLFDATRVWGEGNETTLECAIKIVASAAFYAHGIRVPVVVSGGGIRGALHSDERGTLTWPQLLRQLAVVAQGDGDDLSKALAGLPPGSIVLVAAGLAAASTVQLLTRTTPVHQRMVVVSLEGFGEDWSPSLDNYASPKAAQEALESAGAAVVRCRNGQLTQALDALGRVDAFRGATSRHIQQTVPPTDPHDVSATIDGTVGG